MRRIPMREDEYGDEFLGGDVSLCTEGVREWFDVPEGVKEITLCTSKREPRGGGAYRVEPSPGGDPCHVHIYDGETCVGAVDLYRATAQLFRREPFVWIEFRR